MSAIPLDEAIEVFVRGFCFTRSFTFPYIAKRVHERVWRLHDAHKERGDYRSEEYVGWSIDPLEMHTIARQHTRGRYRLCVLRALEEGDASLHSELKALGYRFRGAEPLMVHSLQQIERVPDPVSIMRITTQEEADSLAKAARSRQILPEHLEADPPPVRQYIARNDEQLIGWVGSITAREYAWCSNMFVLPAYRRRGIARALLTRMLQEDRAAGARANVLLSSHAGTKLYPTVGYQTIGELLVFTPPSDREARPADQAA